MHVSGVGGRATVLCTCEEHIRNWWDRCPIVMLESVRRRTSKTLSTHRQMANRQRSRIGYLKRGYGWDGARVNGTEAARIWTGHGALAHNLVKISDPAA
jgi:hypothetical protein